MIRRGTLSVQWRLCLFEEMQGKGLQENVEINTYRDKGTGIQPCVLGIRLCALCVVPCCFRADVLALEAQLSSKVKRT